MSIGIIELNDAGLRVSNMEHPEEVLHESPGLALLESDGNLLLGDAALAQTRLHPLHSNSFFWHRLSTEPLPFQNASYRHHADLAYSQLLTLHQFIPQCDRIVFALPPTYTREQMALLLGIVDQCPFKAAGLIDSTVAASSALVERHKSFHLDIQLHQCVITEMELANQQLTSTRVEILSGLGLLALWDRWAKAIADQFIDQCRFDPLHNARGEQSLYDQLPYWMAAYSDNDEQVMEVSGKSIRLSRAAFIQAVKPLYEQISKRVQQLADTDSQILIGDRLAKLPAFNEMFRQFGLMSRLPANAIFRNIHQHQNHIIQHDGALRFIRAVPAEAASSVDPQQSAAAEAEPASVPTALHLLVGHRAYPVDGATLYLNQEHERLVPDPREADCSLQRHGEGVLFTPLGSRPATDKKLLYPGDSVGSVRVIEVLQGHGAT